MKQAHPGICTFFRWAGVGLICANASIASAHCAIEQLQGGVRWQRGAAEFKPARLGLRLQAGDEVRTDAKGRVRLRCTDGSALVIANRSQLRIERYEASADQPRWASFWLKLGLIGQTVSPAPGGRWQVRTPTAVTAVRGTQYIVEVGADQSTAVQVTEGEVAVLPANPGGVEAAASAPGEAASGAQEAYASKALASVIPALVLGSAQPGLRCGITQCVPVPSDERRLTAWKKRLGY
jgi:hypothetical protein